MNTTRPFYCEIASTLETIRNCKKCRYSDGWLEKHENNK